MNEGAARFHEILRELGDLHDLRRTYTDHVVIALVNTQHKKRRTCANGGKRIVTKYVCTTESRTTTAASFGNAAFSH